MSPGLPRRLATWSATKPQSHSPGRHPVHPQLASGTAAGSDGGRPRRSLSTLPTQPRGPWRGGLEAEACTREPERVPWTSQPTSVSPVRGEGKPGRVGCGEPWAHILLNKRTSTRSEIRSWTGPCPCPCPLPGNTSSPPARAMAGPTTRQAALPETWDHLNSCLLPPTPAFSVHLRNSASSLSVPSPGTSPWCGPVAPLPCLPPRPTPSSPCLSPPSVTCISPPHLGP